MFDLTDAAITARTQPNEYEFGLKYYKNRRIKSVQYNQEKRAFTANVLGTKLYTLHLKFDMSGRLATADCTCPYNIESLGCCRHMAAVLFLIQEKDRQGFFRELRFRQTTKDIFSFFADRQANLKSTIFLEPTLEFLRVGYESKTMVPSLRLRIGSERLYIVRDIKSLLFRIESSMELRFGKNFTFEPSKHEFKGRDLKLINLIKEIYESEKLIDAISYKRHEASMFADGRVHLTDSALKEFLEIYSDTPFKAVILGKVHEAINIINEDMPVDFLLSNEGRDLLLSINIEGMLLPLTGDGEYFYYNSNIYRISHQQSKYLKPFYLAMMYQKGSKLRFIEEDKQRFVSEILPFAEKAGNLVITEPVQELIEKLPLEAEVFLDRNNSDIVAVVKFKYGSHVINPFLPQFKAKSTPGADSSYGAATAALSETTAAAGERTPSEKLLIRDLNEEEAILDILAMSDFKVMESKVHLSGEENIYDFVFKIVPLLQEHSLVYYSESLKNMNLKTTLPFSAQFRMNTASYLLEFSFDAEGIDRAELVDIMASLRKKKKYYQLKNGSFINLESLEFAQVDDFMGKLDLNPEQLQQEFIELPAYRAVYASQAIRESGIHNIERDAAFKNFVQNIIEPGDMVFKLPPGINGKLRDYQKFGYKWLRALDHYMLGGILADDMGLGKTIQIIALLLATKIEEGTSTSLIIVPTSLVYNWCNELDKFAPDLKYTAIIGNKEERHRLISSMSEFDVAITSYPLIRRDIDKYDRKTFRYCILDEAQYIKNPLSRNARSVKKIKSKSRFALTGTPMENNLHELWSVFDFVLPGYLYSYSKFDSKYVQPSTGEDGCEVLQDLGKQIKPFILRRLKKDVLYELPEKIEDIIIAELTEEQKKLYMAYLMDIKGKIDKDIEEAGFEKNRIKILSALTRLRQLCCHPSLFVEDYRGESGKMQLLEEVLQQSIAGGHRILLFSQFTAMLNIIKRKLDEIKIPYLYLDGATPASDRGYLVNSFNKGLGKVFLISLKAGGTGLNLTGADTVIHFDPWWNPAVEEQATDRTYRIGQKKSVYVMKFVARGTIEEKILALQEKKRKLIDSVIQPGETMLSKMTQEEIRALFDI